MNVRVTTAFVLIGLLSLSPLTNGLRADTLMIEAEVKRTLTTANGDWGGCMVALSVSPADEGLNCPSAGWVTFSCTGEHTTKSKAMLMFDSAMLAFAMGRKVRVWVDDTKKHNGYCFVSRIDVLAETSDEEDD